MKRFSVAVSDELFDQIEVLRRALPVRFEGRWARPWSRDYTAQWLLGRAVQLPEISRSLKVNQPDLLEHVNQKVDGGVQSGDGMPPA